MKTHARAKSTGQSLIAQGEPMVWLTGGMFAIACSMIFALLALILVKGLATHWQRSFAIYPLLSGEFEAGELLYQQPFNISRQSLGQLDEKSRVKAEEVLAGGDQALEALCREIPQAGLATNVDCGSTRRNQSAFLEPKG